jgi:DMSO reductase anchor subunit
MCPYEVPRYSPRLGIVRKCDLCSQRLAAGEPPACAQACPSGAITLSLVDRESLTERYATACEEEAVGRFLPDAPDPRLTLPATRFKFSTNLHSLAAADAVPSTAAPVHWPLVLLLVLTQCAAGLLVIAWVAARWQPVSRLCAVGGLVALGLGAAASISHLGRPAKAWRAFLGWRRSWLSREILVLHATLAAALTALWAPAVQGTAGALGLLLVYASGRVYTEVGRPFWSARRVFTGFYATAIVAGLASGAALAAWAGNEGVARGLATGVLLTAAPIGALRVSERRRALANAAHPIHRNVRLIHTRLARGMRTANGCWVASLAVALMAVETTGIVSAWVAAGLAATVVAYEILERALFFSGGMGRSMPGGIPA